MDENNQLKFSYENIPAKIPAVQTPAVKTSQPEKDVPVGAKIISVLYYIDIVIASIFVILTVINLIKTLKLPGYGQSPIVFVIYLISSVVLSVLFFSIARGLWKGRRWARIAALTVAIITFAVFISIIIMGSLALKTLGFKTEQIVIFAFGIFFGMIIQVIVAGYLFFSERVKEVFA